MVKLGISEKSGSYGKLPSEAGSLAGEQIFTAGIGTRINEAVELIGTRERVSDLIGTSPASLYRYVGEINMPPFDVAARLCAAASVRMEWLATGQEPKSALHQPTTAMSIVLEQLRQAIFAVEQALQESQRSMTPEKKAELITAVYELLATAEGDLPKDLVLRLVRAAV